MRSAPYEYAQQLVNREANKLPRDVQIWLLKFGLRRYLMDMSCTEGDLEERKALMDKVLKLMRANKNIFGKPLGG